MRILKKISIAVLGTVILAGSAGQFAVFAGSSDGTAPAGEGQDALTYLDDDFYMKDGFSTHLPVVVIDDVNTVNFFTEGSELTTALLQKGSTASGVYTEQWKEAAAEGKPEREKTDYNVTVTGESHTELESVLWDRPVMDEWLLLGNMYDKSLLRNYLALTLAGELDISNYLVQYCELFAEYDGRYQYQGVYLLAAPVETEEYHLQRGNYQDTNSKALVTYASENSWFDHQLYVPSVYSLEDHTFMSVENRISLAERSILSADYNTFSKYGEYLDLTKMYDYFILYEMFGNAASGHLSHYLYDSGSGRFWPVALADFEYSVDNGQLSPLEADSFDMIFTPYYQPLSKSINFVDGLQDRYQELKLGLLKSSSLNLRIDDIVASLGDSQRRDWARWDEVYQGDEMYTLAVKAADPDSTGPDLNRNTDSYAQEINKIKFSLRHHGNTMFGSIAELYEQKNMTGNDAGYVTNTLLFLLFLAILSGSIYIAGRRLR